MKTFQFVFDIQHFGLEHVDRETVRNLNENKRVKKNEKNQRERERVKSVRKEGD